MPAMDYERLAHWYDSYVATTLDVPFFLDEARQASAPVLELMAGTGRVSIPLLEAGIELTCVDSSPAMLKRLCDKLGGKGLAGDVIEADVCTLSLERHFGLIFIPFHSFAEIAEPGDQVQALRRVRAHLAEGGRFICTLYNPPARLQRVDGQWRTLGEFPLPDEQGMLILSSAERYDAATQLVTGTQVYEVRDSEGAIVSSDTLDLRWFVHHRDAFAELIDTAGFETMALYGDYARAPFEPQDSPFMIWVLGSK